jgi:hypothetical protein
MVRRPEGAQHVSPGHRPGFANARYHLALKGQNMFCPRAAPSLRAAGDFRSYKSITQGGAALCPGLTCRCLCGAMKVSWIDNPACGSRNQDDNRLPRVALRSLPGRLVSSSSGQRFIGAARPKGLQGWRTDTFPAGWREPPTHFPKTPTMPSGPIHRPTLVRGHAVRD